MKSVLCRRVHFQCVHKYASPQFSEKENSETFGACYTPHGHGHNYTLDAYVEGTIDPVTGMIINLRDLDGLLREVVALLDQHHLNFEVPEFSKVVPTTENIAAYLFPRIQLALKKIGPTLMKIRLYESEDLWVDYTQ